jgi:Domain of unknown function (DUF5619)
MDCTFVTREMLGDPVDIFVDDPGLDFSRAKSMADRKATEFKDDPMLLSWFDRRSGKFSPDVVCCDPEKPSWLVYAESRGGDLCVNVNHEDYVFVYR